MTVKFDVVDPGVLAVAFFGAAGQAGDAKQSNIVIPFR